VNDGGMSGTGGADAGRRDWQAWHSAYDEEGSPLQRRLKIVQGHVRDWLEARQGQPLRVVSVCAGEGRDLLGVLAGHPDARHVSARLVELDPRNVAAAEAAAQEAGLSGVEVMQADAGSSDSYRGAVPADLVLVCGVFGNISDSDIRQTVTALPQLCAPDATVVWTRSRHEPDRTPTIRGWFAHSGFEELAFDAPDDALFSVGVHRLVGRPSTLMPDEVLFRFTTDVN
jgi:putative methyltransferase